jgi:hypothetical protein
MKKRYCILILVVFICPMFIPSLASADLLKVDIDLTSFAGSPVTLGFALLDSTWAADSSIEIDNIAWDGIVTPDLLSAGWILDPTVSSTGSAMLMKEDPDWFYVLASVNHTPLIGTLSFDLDTSLVGDDYFQVSVTSSIGSIPAINSALVVDATGVDTAYTSPLTTVVPVPSAVLLAGLGLGTSALGILRNKRKL